MYPIHRDRLIRAMGYQLAKLDASLCVTHLNVIVPTRSCFGEDAIFGRCHITIMPTSIGRKHRIFVNCKCGRLIPFGRVCQHVCKTV